MARAANASVSTTQALAVGAAHAVSSDIPICEPSQDAYGIDGFAKALAQGIATANAVEGLVFAVNGPWGSGKSSAINLVLHHLKASIEAETIIPLTFNPWWFSGSETLTVSFFQELSVPIGKSVTEQAREALASLGRRVSSVGPLLGPLAAAFGLPGAAVVAAGAGVAAKLKPERTVEEEHERLATELRKQPKKFLVVIDDIDRLGTDEALQMFRLVKSVGRLPNVVYLLAFDRQLAEKMIAERFPSEGPAYLDKFIQGGFDLPMPDSHDLREAVLRVVNDVMGGIEPEKATRFYNIFYDVCAPLIRLPRDAVRLGNAIRVTWPSIGAEIDRADFLAIESLRLFLPDVHRAIRSHPDMLCGTDPRSSADRNRDRDRKEYGDVFLSGLTEREEQIARRALQRLFPRTDYVWSNIIHSDKDEWRRNRLICSEVHFPTYFGFAVDEDAVTASEFQELLRVSGNAEEVAALFRRAVSSRRRRGGTRAALLLEELQVQAQSVPEENISALLTGLFSVADEIYVDTDSAGGFDIESNQLRIHWILNNLLRDRLGQVKRGQILESACQRAALGWLVDLARRCARDHEPEGQGQGQQFEAMVPTDAAARIGVAALNRLRGAAADGSLIVHPEIRALIFRWNETGNSGEVRQWTDAQLANDSFVVNFSERSVGHSWSRGLGVSGLGDRVARRNDYIDLQPFAELVDIPRLRERVRELLSRQSLPEDDRKKLQRFLDMPERTPRQD